MVQTCLRAAVSPKSGPFLPPAVGGLFRCIHLIACLWVLLQKKLGGDMVLHMGGDAGGAPTHFGAWMVEAGMAYAHGAFSFRIHNPHRTHPRSICCTTPGGGKGAVRAVQGPHRFTFGGELYIFIRDMY